MNEFEGEVGSSSEGSFSVLAGGIVDEPARGGIVTARGTGDGLILRIDGRVDGSSLKEAVMSFLNSRKSFLSGNQVALEWIATVPAQVTVSELSELLSSHFHIKVRSSTLWEQPIRTAPTGETLSESVHSTKTGARDIGRKVVPSSASASKSGPIINRPATSGRSPSLFDGIEAYSGAMEEVFADEAKPASEKASLGVDSALWDDPDARFIYGTIRSGQKIETEHSLLIFGDVNSGAELVAGGDIVVLGTLRGTAHAGAYDETGGGRVIFSLNLQPTQLRIGMTISRGSSESASVPEIARVDGNNITVAPYSARNGLPRRR